MKKINVLKTKFGVYVSVGDLCQYLNFVGCLTEKQSFVLFHKIVAYKSKQLASSTRTGYYSNLDLFIMVSMTDIYMSWACFHIVWQYVKKHDNKQFREIMMLIDSPNELCSNHPYFNVINTIVF